MDKSMFFNRREFLNTENSSSDASISSHIFFRKDDGASHDITVKIKDCHDDISLYFGLDDSDETTWRSEQPNFYKDSLAKIDKIVEHLLAFKEAFIQAKPEYEKRKKQEAEKTAQREAVDLLRNKDVITSSPQLVSEASSHSK